MSGVVPVYHLYAFMVSVGKTSPFTVCMCSWSIQLCASCMSSDVQSFSTSWWFLTHLTAVRFFLTHVMKLEFMQGTLTGCFSKKLLVNWVSSCIKQIFYTVFYCSRTWYTVYVFLPCQLGDSFISHVMQNVFPWSF
jgi:hypothetical protein